MNVYLPGNITDMQGPCAEGFHVPLESEWEGVNTIMGTLNLLNRDNYVSKLHIPLTGLRLYSTSNVSGQGSTSSAHIYRCIDYVSSVSNSTLRINSDGTIAMDNTYKGHGNSIRPFHNGYVVPTSSWTVIEGTLGSAGIFRDTVNGLISITGDGTTGYTIADKNCGATTVYNSGDTLSEANCGKYYQYGNNYGFPFTGTVTTSSTQVNAESYGPGNYYSSSTFITNNPRDSSNNTNLRGGETGLITEMKNAYIGEYIPWTPDASRTLLYLKFENNTNDSSGNNVSVSSAGLSYGTAGNKKYAQRTGTSSGTYITPNTSTLSSIGTGDFTVSFFLYPVSPVSGQKALIAGYRNQNDSSYPGIQLLFTSDNKFFLQLSNSYQYTTSDTFSRNQWYYITITRISGTVKLYINGVQKLSFSSSINLSNATNWYILNRSNYTNQAWNETGARLSEVIYEKIGWTQQEILDYYNYIKLNY